jgi:hypothetical protein
MRLFTGAAVFLPAVLLSACTPAEGGTADASTGADIVLPENPCNIDMLESVQWIGPNFCCGGDSGVAPTLALSPTLVLPDTPPQTVCSQSGEEVLGFCTCTFGCVTSLDGGGATCVWPTDAGDN